jgi:Zn-dependent protease
VGGLVIALVILSLGLHEFAHAFVANLCGDPTAREMGRMTPDPRPHIDPIWTILVPCVLYMAGGIIFGGARPVPVNYHRLRRPSRDMMLVAIAGPLMNVLIAIVLMAITKLLLAQGGMGRPGDTALGYVVYAHRPAQIATLVLTYATQINIVLAIFNMLPVPPLDGSRVLAFFLPSPMRETYMRLDRFAMLFVFLILFSGALRPIILTAFVPLARLVNWVAGGGAW